MKNLTWQNPEQLFVAQELINKVKSKCCGIKDRIKVVLVEQKKTGKWLAEKLGVSVTTVSRWCSNSTQPDLQILSKIATLLKVDTRDLLTPLNKDFQYPKQ